METVSSIADVESTVATNNVTIKVTHVHRSRIGKCREALEKLLNKFQPHWLDQMPSYQFSPQYKRDFGGGYTVIEDTIWNNCLYHLELDETEIFRAGLLAYVISQEIKNRSVVMPVTISKVFEGKSVYGDFYIYTFTSGNYTLVYKGSKKIDGAGVKSKDFLSGTVKDHSLFGETKQTLIQRYTFKLQDHD